MRSPTHLFSTVAAFLLAASPSPAAPEPPAAATNRNVPAWAAEAVWYQIFPERFRNGDPTNDPTRASLETPVIAGPDWKVSPWAADWYSREDWEKHAGPDFYKHGVFERRYGGDLQGVLDKLDYLSDLGINALYFCPLFYARSLHKYDGASYHHIDPYFGPDPTGDFALIEKETSDPATWHWTAADKLFLQVVKAAHAKKMRVIIDGVFNHTGRDFFAFQNLTKLQENSPYKDWYIVRAYDDPGTKRDEFMYEGWWGHKTLPIFAFTPDKQNMPAAPKRYIFDACARWLNPAAGPGAIPGAEGIDGWRLDVADERPNPFWADWNDHVRKVQPTAYTTAEVWKESSSLLLGGHFSGAMNYHAFAIPVKGWLVDDHLKPSVFARMLDTRRAELPRPVAFAMQNLMDSHDTDRLASMIVNGNAKRPDSPTEVEYNGNNDLREAPDYKISRPNERERAVQRLVALFQMTYVGAPMIYYGDESGMWGAHDPDNRLPMVWADLQYAPQATDPRPNHPRTSDPVAFDQGVFDYYKRAIALRRSHPILSHGEYQLLAADDDADTLAFTRRSGVETLVVAFNRSEKEQTVVLRPPPGSVAGRNWLLGAEPAVLFSTALNAADVPSVEAGSESTVRVKLPPLGAVVLGAKSN